MAEVPVVPGDGRVSCQHCPARIEYTDGPGAAWIDRDAADSSGVLWCAPAQDTRNAIWHKPMPQIGVPR